VETGGKQYQMATGDVLDVELLPGEVGSKVILDKVLFFSGGGEVKIGQPYLEGARVEAVLVDRFKDKKVIVFKFRHKTGYRRLRGHRQNYSRIKVEKIEIPGMELITAPEKAEKMVPKKEKKAAKKETVKKE
jgi:large subunit ribosomal protein L21